MEEPHYQQLLRNLKARIGRIKAIKQTEPKIEIETLEAAEDKEIPLLNEIDEYKSIETGETAPKPIQILTSRKQEVKEHIKSILYQGQAETIQLKHRVVDQEKRCSKASFYRYIKELQQEHHVLKITVEQKEYCVLAHTGQ